MASCPTDILAEDWGVYSLPACGIKSPLKPYPEVLMDAHDVSPIVNAAKYDGPECIRPISDGDMPRAPASCPWL